MAYETPAPQPAETYAMGDFPHARQALTAVIQGSSERLRDPCIRSRPLLLLPRSGMLSKLGDGGAPQGTKLGMWIGVQKGPP